MSLSLKYCMSVYLKTAIKEENSKKVCIFVINPQKSALCRLLLSAMAQIHRSGGDNNCRRMDALHKHFVLLNITACSERLKGKLHITNNSWFELNTEVVN